MPPRIKGKVITICYIDVSQAEGFILGNQSLSKIGIHTPKQEERNGANSVGMDGDGSVAKQSKSLVLIL